MTHSQQKGNQHHDGPIVETSQDFITTGINMFKDIKKEMVMNTEVQQRKGNYKIGTIKKYQNF